MGTKQINTTLHDGFKEMADTLYKKGFHTTASITDEYARLQGFNGLSDSLRRQFISCAGIVCAEYALGRRNL